MIKLIIVMTHHQITHSQHCAISMQLFCRWRSNYQQGVLDPIDRLNSATLVCLYKSQNLEIQRHTSWFFSVLSCLR